MFFKALSLPLINRERLLILGWGVLRLRRRQQDQYKVQIHTYMAASCQWTEECLTQLTQFFMFVSESSNKMYLKI